ncbi:D-arabinono-1,4-lactone oxidase [Dermacoccaceae bacterium W4C1]
MAEWRNWAGNVRAEGIDVLAPATVEEVVAAVTLAARTGRKVKPVGSGHSFTEVARPVDLQLQLHRLSGIIAVDPATHRVRVRSGTRLRELNGLLDAAGLAMPNLGDFDGQTLAGALSTGTHGTGAALTGLTGFVVGVELVTADGAVLRFDQDNSPERVPGVALGLGALGVVTEYEIQCVPAFLVHAHEAPASLEEVLDGLQERVASVDHFEFYWFPHTDLVSTKTNTRLHDPADRPEPLPRWRAFLDDKLLANTLFEGINRALTRVPAAVPAVNRISGRALTEREYTDRSDRVFATERTVRFVESEFAVEPADLAPLLRELRGYFDRREQLISFPLEIRFAAADEVWMSTAHGRPSAYVAIHQYHRKDPMPYFRDAWSMLPATARPHWGKVHELGAQELRNRYPRFDDFVALRDELDPQRVFGNPYLERVLGS